MNPLILWRLKKYCDEHELDYQELDDTLTYWENMEHLKSLTPDTEIDLELRWRAEIDRFIDYSTEHFLQYYLDAAKRGQTLPVNMGPRVISTKFSFADMMEGNQHGRT